MKKYFDWEQAFQHIGQNADLDGIWQGDAASLGAEFAVSEDEGYAVLGEISDRGLIERIDQRAYSISNWRERDEEEKPQQ